VSQHRFLGVLLLHMSSVALSSALADSAPSPTPSVVINPNGTVQVTRVVPVPSTISEEAQAMLAKIKPAPQSHQTLQEHRTDADKLQTEMGEKSLKLYPAKLATDVIAGVHVRIVTPPTIAPEKTSRVLINLHGGGFRFDAGSLSESIPIANLTGTEVISVLYRLTPENKFPAAIDDVVAVYKELLKTHKPADMGIYGTSAGGFLTAQVAAELRKLKLPLPAALGIFAGGGNCCQAGDSEALFDLGGLTEPIDTADLNTPDLDYIGSTDPKDPVLSPLYSDLRNFPATLFVTSTRDVELSGTSILHRAFLRAGVDAQLVVFEALPHAFWHDPTLPESKEANQLMAAFFDRHLGK
jgi:monoterpene epsilon-lactone hydrolase